MKSSPLTNEVNMGNVILGARSRCSGNLKTPSYSSNSRYTLFVSGFFASSVILGCSSYKFSAKGREKLNCELFSTPQRFLYCSCLKTIITGDYHDKSNIRQQVNRYTNNKRRNFRQSSRHIRGSWICRPQNSIKNLPQISRRVRCLNEHGGRFDLQGRKPLQSTLFQPSRRMVNRYVLTNGESKVFSQVGIGCFGRTHTEARRAQSVNFSTQTYQRKCCIAHRHAAHAPCVIQIEGGIADYEIYGARRYESINSKPIGRFGSGRCHDAATDDHATLANRDAYIASSDNRSLIINPFISTDNAGGLMLPVNRKGV